MTVVEAPRTHDPSHFFGWVVTVLNDHFNTFDHVASTLARVVPGIDVERGWQLAREIDANGSASVFVGMKEPAEHYWQELVDAGLTMAPLSQG